MAKVPTEIKASKFRTLKEIMDQPSMKAKLMTYVDEAILVKGKIAFERQNLKALQENAVNEINIKPAIFNAYVTTMFNNDYSDRREKLEELTELMDQIEKEQLALPGPRAED